MIKTFLINLPQEKKRLKAISQQLSKFNIDFEIFSAIVGKELSVDDLHRLYDSQKSLQILGREMNNGEIGCSLSHMNIYHKITQENIPLSLILEDDGFISPKLQELVLQLNHMKKPVGWDYLSLNYTIFDWITLKKFWLHIYLNYFKKKRIGTAISHRIGSLIFAFIDWILILFSKFLGYFQIPAYKPMYLTGGYFITLEGAQKLLAIHEKVFLPADVFVEYARKYHNLKFSVCIPMLIKQNEHFVSSIQKP